MNNTNRNVLVLTPSIHMRGGIPSVVKAHMKGAQWAEYNCKIISTHIDKGAHIKIARNNFV